MTATMKKKLKRMKELQSAVEEFERLKKEVKDAAPRVLGNGDHPYNGFTIRVSTYRRATYQVPVKVKEKYRVEDVEVTKVEVKL